MTKQEMEELVKKMNSEIDTICVGFYYYKDENVLNKGSELLENIRIFCSILLQEIMEEPVESRQEALQNYVLGVLKDYMEALEQQDMILMLDVLDHGLRELLNIYIENNEKDEENESGDF